MRTTARRDGDAWVIDGTKQWITSGAYAGVILVWARTAPPEAGTRGISCFLVEGGAPGLKVGRPEDKMGIRGSSTVPLELASVRVPSGALLGEENGGFKIAMMALDGGRIGISAQAVGIARAALDESVAYAKDRRAFGVPIAEHQAIQWKLADMRASIDAAHLLSMRAAWLKQARRPFSREASMAKLFASEAAVRVCNDERRADPRRVRLYARATGRAPLTRRARHDDLRGHERDSAPRHRARPLNCCAVVVES